MDTALYNQKLLEHYTCNWGQEYNVLTWPKGPYKDLGDHFRVLEFPPTTERNMWAYATIGMSGLNDEFALELHMFSGEQDETLVESLIVVAHYHRFGASLGHWHTINWGRGWRMDSPCSYGLISLPYLDGPKLEILILDNNKSVHFYWLLPITEEEVAFKKENGAEKLEEIFEERGLNYLDPFRDTLV
ncbi:suppressor of fused domain protein [Sphingobacterium siyangense]|uniref:suppressor of fused domain protein n=1 Tax=Sphingobacterium siyangense TaxID=459529 RepID=UPI003C72BB8E